MFRQNLQFIESLDKIYHAKLRIWNKYDAFANLEDDSGSLKLFHGGVKQR